MSAKKDSFSLSAELRCYKQIWQRHWPLVLSIGLFFVWLYLLPLAGTLVWDLTRNLDVSPSILISFFLSGNILGMVTAAVLSHFRPRWSIWFSIGSFPCAAVSLLVLGIPSPLWWLLFLFMGVFGGMATIGWGLVLTSAVPGNSRGRALVSGIGLSGFFLLFISLFIDSAQSDLNILVISLMLLGVPIVLVYRRREEMSGKILENTSSEYINGKVKRTANFGLFLFIFIIFVIGSMTLFVMNYMIPSQKDILGEIGWLPYFLLLFVAGSVGDILGRRTIAIVGVVAAGIGLMSAGPLSMPAQYLVIQILAFGGYAFLDAFAWIMAADLSAKRLNPVIFAVVMSVYMLATLAGVNLGDWIVHLENKVELVTISLSGISIILSLVLILRLKETRTSAEVINYLPADITAEALTERFSLTRREAEIAVLLLNEVSTDEILKKTSIAYTTLKGHCRNIYQKAGVRNRLEFTLAVMKETRPETKVHRDSIAETES
ncbi:MAG: hypothetical protein JXA46_00750 [Dehalococcoidales bacterium]|nr:hypothetical protein [Dehalococcoidales bacterium]